MWHRCKTVDYCKKLFRRLALMIHPDKGGEADIFITIQESYEMELINRKSKEYKPPKYQPQERLYEQRYDKVHEGDPDLNILSEIEEYASTHPKFNCDYLHAMIDYLNTYTYLTSNQYNKLVNVYYAFGMQNKKY